MKEFDVRSSLRGQTPRVPFERIADAILGNSYSLSLLICGDALARRINTESRKKMYAPNVLSFPLSKSEGEIVLNVNKAEREARALHTTKNARIAYLFIHGCLHLIGHDHSNSMDRAEDTYMKKFGYPAL